MPNSPDPADTLRHLTETISSFSEATTDYPRLLQTIVERVGKLERGFCSISLLSPDRDHFDEVVAWDDDPKVRDALVEVTKGMVVAGRPNLTAMLETGKPILRAQLDPKALAAAVKPEHLELVMATQLTSLLFWPLRVHGEPIGVLNVIRHGGAVEPLGERDLEFTQSLADHAGLAVSNARLFAESARLTRRLELRAEIGVEFAAKTSDYSGLIDLMTRRIATVLGDMCTVLLLTPDGKLDSQGAAFHTNPALLEDARMVSHGRLINLNEGIAGKVVSSGEPSFVPSITIAEHSATVDADRRPYLDRLKIHSVIAVPLKADGKTIGAIIVSRTALPKVPFTSDDFHLLIDLASQASVSIVNSRLLVDARRELKERLQAEKALLATEEQLRHAQKMEAVGRLAGGLAHDFNNLLSVVLSYCSLLIPRFPMGDPVRDDLEEIAKAGRRAADLTKQLLAFSRQQVASPKVLDLQGLVREMEPMIRRLIGEDIQLKVVTQPGTHRVLADPGHLEQVLMNLVVNARDAMPNGGMLTIETGNVVLDDHYANEHLGVTPGAHAMLAVSDTGEGMDKVTKERIFEPFFTTKEKGKGTGLGLSTVFGIIKQGNGSIWVYSELGKGTSFKIYLPRTHQETTPVLPVVAPKPALGSATILLVEDEDQLRAVARSVLKRSGYQVLDAPGGAEALVLASAFPGQIDLMLTDVVMPQMSGRQLAAKLEPLRPTMRVLYMSGYTENAIVHHGVLDEGIQLLQKPITPDLLLTKVREVLAMPAPRLPEKPKP